MTVTLILASGGAIGFLLTFLTALTKDAHHDPARKTVTFMKRSDEVLRNDESNCGNCAA